MLSHLRLNFGLDGCERHPHRKGQDMDSTSTNPRVTMRLTYSEFERYVANHSGHFTSEAGKRIAGELAEGSQHGYRTLRKITCHRHGETCSAEYDNGAGFYLVSTSAYATEAEAWADTAAIPCLDPMGWQS